SSHLSSARWGTSIWPPIWDTLPSRVALGASKSDPAPYLWVRDSRIFSAMRSCSASVSVVVIGSTSRRRVPGDGLGRQRYGRAPCLCSALPSPPGTCGKPPGSLLLLVSSGGTGGHHRLSASPDRAGKPFAVLRLLPERRGDGIQDRDALGVGRLLGGEVSTRPLRAETKADAAVHASRGWEGEPGGRVG